MNADMQNLDAVMFLVQVFTTFVMTGIVWFLQLVHYPLFRKVARSRFVPFERMQLLLTSFVVAPPVLLETAAVLYSLWRKPPWMDPDAVLLGAVLLGIIWVTILFVHGPQHRALQQRFDPKAYRILLYTNWIPSYAWSSGLAVLFAVLLRIITHS